MKTVGEEQNLKFSRNFCGGARLIARRGTASPCPSLVTGLNLVFNANTKRL